MKTIYILVLCLLTTLSYAQIESVEDANADLKERIEALGEEIDETTAVFDSMDNVAEELQAESDALDDQIQEAEEKIEAAERELEKEKEPAEWRGLAKILIIVFAVFAILWIFRKRRKNA